MSTKALLLFIIQFFLFIDAYSQIDIRNDRATIRGPGGAQDESEAKIEWLDEANFGFYASDLTAKASAQILRYRIGESNGFNVPLKLILSSPGMGLGDASQEQITLNSLIAPTGGVINALVDDSRLIWEIGNQTSISLSYGLGYKLVNGVVATNSEPVNFSTIYGTFGFRFITGAWVDRSEDDKTGVFLIQLRGFSTSSVGEHKLSVMEVGLEDDLFLGLTGDVALFITDAIDLRLSISHCFNKFSSNSLKPGFVRFTVDYGLSNEEN